MDTAAALSPGIAVAALGFKISTSAIDAITIKVGIVAAFTVNVFAVQIPGRLDGEVARAMKEKAEGEKVSEASNALLPASGKSYVTPSGWAFAIWGPIYIGELVFSAWVGLSKLDGAANETMKEMLPFWVSANLFQSLWCATFRPRFHVDSAKRTLGPFVSAFYLGLTALSLGKASLIISRKSSDVTMAEKAAFVPLTMHFGWTTAATLVNVNGALANYKNAGSDRNLYVLGCASIVTALTASAAVAFKTKQPTYSLVVGWALFAVSSGMKARIGSLSGGVALDRADRIRSISYCCGAASVLIGAAALTASCFSSRKEA